MKMQQVTMELAAGASEDREVVGAVASNYLNLFALVTLGVVWIRQLLALESEPDGAFKTGKHQTARYFFEMVLPEAGLFARLVGVGKGPMMDFDVENL